ncbi:hypothetical protein J4225_00430 [Candidatus Pacearchaeota archaeon]|nr:hypothetical protein [uncultured archaeon]MBS3085136.1 hypothetical protein [Candidatus Pacearchaeota archaeon]
MKQKSLGVEVYIIRTRKTEETSKGEPIYRHYLNGKDITNSLKESLCPPIRIAMGMHCDMLTEAKIISCIESRVEKEIK